MNLYIRVFVDNETTSLNVLHKGPSHVLKLLWSLEHPFDLKSRGVTNVLTGRSS